MIFYKKHTSQPTLSSIDAVDVALCFGWIDGRRKPLDEERCIQFFSKRKPKSTWSKINKEKTEALISKGLMAQAGHESIAVAKSNGSWTILDEVEALIIPSDLELAFKINTEAEKYFLSLSKSKRKSLLLSLMLSKQYATRQKQIAQILSLEAKLNA